MNAVGSLPARGAIDDEGQGVTGESCIYRECILLTDRRHVEPSETVEIHASPFRLIGFSRACAAPLPTSHPDKLDGPPASRPGRIRVSVSRR